MKQAILKFCRMINKGTGQAMLMSRLVGVFVDDTQQNQDDPYEP